MLMSRLILVMSSIRWGTLYGSTPFSFGLTSFWWSTSRGGTINWSTPVSPGFRPLMFFWWSTSLGLRPLTSFWWFTSLGLRSLTFFWWSTSWSTVDWLTPVSHGFRPLTFFWWSTSLGLRSLAFFWWSTSRGTVCNWREHRKLMIAVTRSTLQWNPSITDTFGEQCFGLYTEVAFVEGLFCTQIVHLGPGCLAVI